MRIKLICLMFFLQTLCFVSNSLASEKNLIKMTGYEALLSDKGKLKRAVFKGAVFIENAMLVAYPAEKTGRLFQGGNPPECVETIVKPGELKKENENVIFSKKAALGNSKYPEIIAYNMNMIFSEEEINIFYEIEYLLDLKWRFYGASFVFHLPEKMIAGRGWIAEMSEGSSVNAGRNPLEFRKDNRAQWLYIDNGSRLCLESAVGKIQFLAEQPSYLRGGKGGIYVISMPRDEIIPKGTKQKLNFKIILPKIKKERDAE